MLIACNWLKIKIRQLCAIVHHSDRDRSTQTSDEVVTVNATLSDVTEDRWQWRLHEQVHESWWSFSLLRLAAVELYMCMSF